MSVDPELIEIINNNTRTIEQLTGMVEAQRLMIEDLYAIAIGDADRFREHAEIIKSATPRGSLAGVPPELAEIRHSARQQHLEDALESAARRIERRAG